MLNAHAEQWKKSRKIKTLKHRMTNQKKHSKYSLTVQGSDNKILLIKIVFNEGKCKIVPSCT